ncbi:permease-like cell division protein FtsX [Candidatus Galacturonibacter soehngenii]|uniref:Cell division protein FtsX n=1 Tax=Candidatus Galacturonatibacter soehngenii TaxID=2307010 RepID=A0A7V7QHI5_9FIRM|nr:permease-like cell division protein FtsX [Candidatus Galacturonibacter soehngenii]KAB1434413.1 ABC transporter permease [Candidatus Galacturonibacter soehngenii]MBA4686759.1 FtsX-like permease family protein [Candidatus Galacturonibacter soehngenii]
MRISSIAYSLKQGIKNIVRNKMFSLASIATMAACIFLLGLFYAVVANFQHIVKSAEEGVSITVFFDEGITQEQIDAIGNEIGKRVEVSKYNYISEDDAWQAAINDYFGGDESVASSFEGDNPLVGSSSYEIYLNDVSMQKALVTYLESLDGVRQVNRSEIVADMLTNFNVLVGYISLAIIIILLAVAVFLISNTVTIGIAVRREEISIMKLIGATDFFVRAPFIVEGILIGLIGSCIPLIALYYMYRNIIQLVTERFKILQGVLTFLPVNSVFEILTPVSLLIGIGIGFLGSFITIRKHLKV